MKEEIGTVVNKDETGDIDALMDRYLSDPESLSLEDQREVYRHLLDRMNQAGAGTQEIEFLKVSLAAVEQALEKAAQGDPGYLKTTGGTYRKRGAEMKIVSIDQLILDPGFQSLFQDIEGEDFEQLKESIREIGIIAPIVVDPEMRVICGHQRLRAAREIGLETIPVVVRWVGEEATLAVIAIEENIRRRQLQPSEMARAIKKLVELKEKIHRAQEVAREVGFTTRQVSRYRDLSDLIPEISVLLDGGKLTQAAAIQIAQMDEDVQRLFHDALGDRIAHVVSEQKAIEFKKTHADLLNQVRNLSELMQKIEQRKGDLETRLKEMQERLDQAEFKVGGEIQNKKVLEEELEKTRSEMYQKVQEKQALIDKLHKNIEPMVVPPPDYQTLKDENEKLKETLKQTTGKSRSPADTLAAELHTLVTGRLLTINPQAFKVDLSPKPREILKDLIQPLETWVGQLKQVIQGAGKAEKKRSQNS